MNFKWFSTGDIPGIGTFYNFFDSLWGLDFDNVKPKLKHKHKRKRKRKPKKGEKLKTFLLNLQYFSFKILSYSERIFKPL